MQITDNSRNKKIDNLVVTCISHKIWLFGGVGTACMHLLILKNLVADLIDNLTKDLVQ